MQVVNGSTPFQTGQSGVGSVIFDYPKEQPLDMLLEANKDIDTYNKAKALKIAQDTKARQQMFANIKFNTKGALPQDIQNTIAPKANEVYDLATKVFALPQNSPEFAQGMIELKRKQDEVEQLTNASNGFKDLFLEGHKPFDPNKVNVDHTNTNFALLAAAPLEKRSALLEAMGGTPIVPNKTSFFDILKKDYKQLPKSEEIVKDAKGSAVIEKLPNGEQLFTKEKGLNEEAVTNLGLSYFNSPSSVDKATSEYNDLQTTDPVLKTSLEQEAKLRGVSPIRVYIEDNIRKLPKESKKERVVEGYAYKKSLNEGYKNKEKQDNAKYLLEQLGNMKTGADAAYNIPGLSANKNADPSLGTIPLSTGKEIKYGNTLRGTNAGIFSYETTDAQGNRHSDVKQNALLGNKWVDGKPYIQTSESMYNIGGAINGQKVDDDGYIPLDDNIVTSVLVANKVPLSVGRKALIEGGAYEGNSPKLDNMASTTKPVQKPATTNTKRDFGVLSITDKQALQKKSGAKSQEEFKKWLLANNYTF